MAALFLQQLQAAYPSSSCPGRSMFLLFSSNNNTTTSSSSSSRTRTTPSNNLLFIHPQSQCQRSLIQKKPRGIAPPPPPPPSPMMSVVNEFAATDIAYNKVVVAAVVSAAIGQLSKPFTSAFLYGRKYNFDARVAFQAGGFPSSHSSAVVATATALGLERGFSDAIFGLAVVYAGLVMYDAQGVRKEVGVHAKALNQILARQSSIAQAKDSDDLMTISISSHSLQSTERHSNSEGSSELSVVEPGVNSSNMTIAGEQMTEKSDNAKGQSGDRPISSSSSVPLPSLFSSNIEGEASEKVVKRLKESVGHSEIEVLAGALLGFVVSLAVYTIT